MKIAYEPMTMRRDTLAIALRAADIAEQYNRDGYDLTLRQLYYQFVALGLTAFTATGAPLPGQLL